MNDVSRETPGQVAYQAYGPVVAHRSYDGQPLRAWDDLPEIIRKAWEAAATAVLWSPEHVQAVRLAVKAGDV